MATLAEAARLCLQSFSTLLSHFANIAKDHGFRQQIPPAGLQDQRGRFRVWCGNLGALQEGHASLDYRLRESTVMQGTVGNLIKILFEELRECTSILSGERPPLEVQAEIESENEDDDENESRHELQVRYSNIIDVLDTLNKLAFKIRDPTATRMPGAATLRVKMNRYMGADLLSQFALRDKQYVRELLSELRGARSNVKQENEYLVDRLAEALTQRRNQFRYWERHAEKLKIDVFDIFKVSESDQTTSAEPDEEVRSNIGDIAGSHGGTLLSGTEATTYHDRDDNFSQTTSNATSINTALNDDGADIELPRSPDDALEGKDFVCPYCKITCPAKEGLGRRWKSHVVRDLKPYVCTYAQCDDPDRMYSGRQQWITHEATSHRTSWHCHEHPEIAFASESEVMMHYRNIHRLDDRSARALLNFSGVPGQDNRPCPICLKDISKDREQHLAIHLLRIALFALPGFDGEGETVGIDNIPEYETHESQSGTEDDDEQGLTTRDIHIPPFMSKDYDTLPKMTRSMRLLVLHPASPEDLQLQGDLITIGLDSNITYQTVSYSGGVDEPTKRSFIALRKEGKLYAKYITSNLFNALRTFRSTRRDRYLWCDAICINDADLYEKNLGVAAMPEIYSRARRTLVWLGTATSSSRLALQFIKKEVLQLQNFDELCGNMDNSKNWLALLELMQRPWFTRKHAVQEVVLSRKAVLYCGETNIAWNDFATAVELFVEVETATHRLSEVMKKDQKYYYVPGWFEYVSALPASLMVDATAHIFRYSKALQLKTAKTEGYDSVDFSDPDESSDSNGDFDLQRSRQSIYSPLQREPLMSLQYLVTALSVFETTVEHDTIYAFLTISRDCTPVTPVRPREYGFISDMLELFSQRKRYVVDYSLPYVDVCRNFIQFCIERSRLEDPSRALDIICQAWAKDEEFIEHRRWQNEVKNKRQAASSRQSGGGVHRSAKSSFPDLHGPQPPQLSIAESPSGRLAYGQALPLPSWVTPLSRATYGMFATPGIQTVKLGRKNADPLAGLTKNYNAAGTRSIDMSVFRFRRRPEFYSMYVEGFVLDELDEIGPLSQGGAIPPGWNVLGGWHDIQSQEPPDEFWRTLVADRGRDGRGPPIYYARACKESFLTGGYGYGSVNTTDVINYERNSVVIQFCRRVQAVIWNRALVKTKNGRLGLVNRNVRKGDLICIIYGCSVPVVLRRSGRKTDKEIMQEAMWELQYLTKQLSDRLRKFQERRVAFKERVARNKILFAIWNQERKSQWQEDLDWRRRWQEMNSGREADIDKSLRLDREFDAWKREKGLAAKREGQRDSRPPCINWNKFELRLRYGRIWKGIVSRRKEAIRQAVEENFWNMDRTRGSEVRMSSAQSSPSEQTRNQNTQLKKRQGSAALQIPSLSEEEAHQYQESIYQKCVSRLGSEDSKWHYLFLGECYVHGMMDGEAIAYQNAERIRHQTFELR